METEYMYKIVLIGDWGVGKTNILSQYTRGEFILGSAGTIGVQFSTKVLQIDNAVVKVQVWDTAGQDKYRAITSTYYRGAHGALAVYDITRADTFNRLENWLKELKEYVKDDCAIVIVGNKSDLPNLAEVKTEKAKNFAKENSYAFFETSALNASNINNAFDAAIQQIHSIQSKNFSQGNTLNKQITGKKIAINLNEQTLGKKKGCCS
jgi:small GTP-binding protein